MAHLYSLFDLYIPYGNFNFILVLVLKFPGSLNLSFHNLSIHQFSRKNLSLAQFKPRIYNKIIIKILGYFWGVTGKISIFVSFSFLSFSLSDFFFSFSLLLASPLFFSIGFSPFLPYPTHSSLCLLSISFSFLSFALFSHFLISFFSFIFSFLFLLWIASTELSQKGETSSPFPPFLLVILTFFLIIFISLYFSHVTHGSI